MTAATANVRKSNQPQPRGHAETSALLIRMLTRSAVLRDGTRAVIS
jgi:hypothetical protein